MPPRVLALPHTACHRGPTSPPFQEEEAFCSGTGLGTTGAQTVLLGLWGQRQGPQLFTEPFTPLLEEAKQGSEPHLQRPSLGATLTLKVSMSSPRKYVPGSTSGEELGCQCRRHRGMGLIRGSGRSTAKGMAAHPSVLAWRIPWTEKSGGLQSMGSQSWDD